MARAEKRPVAPFFWRRRGWRRSFGVGNPKNCSGYVGLAAGFPGTYLILTRDLPGLRDDPKNCSGYCTRALTSRQAALGIFGSRYFSAAWDSNPNNCSLCCLGCCWVSGFGLRGFGIGDRGMCISPYLYTYYPHWFSSILAKISRINWDFVGFFACSSIKYFVRLGINKKQKVRKL